MSDQKINLLDISISGLEALMDAFGQPRFRATQLISWIHQHKIIDFEKMTNLSKSFRQQLIEKTEIKFPEICYQQISKDGTAKWLLRLWDGNIIEMVFIPERDRGTLCVSSQVGCALNCSFCSTGKEGFNRNLSLGEIISQVWLASSKFKVTNVVMMGMGEPLLNFDNVIAAMALMMNDYAYGLSKYRVTLSTSGVIPAMHQLQKVSNVALAVSLHAPTDELRNQLVPLNKKYPLKQLMAVCRDYYPRQSKRKVTFEYVMLKDINDTPLHAKQLINLLKQIPCKVNLIPFNPFPKTRYETSSWQTIMAFQQILVEAGIATWVRKTRGQDIDAACGQLAGDIQDRTGRHKRWLRTGIIIPNGNL